MLAHPELTAEPDAQAQALYHRREYFKAYAVAILMSAQAEQEQPVGPLL